MMPGLPDGDKKFEIMADASLAGDCVLDGSLLHVLYQRRADDNTLKYKVVKFDLNNFDGDEENQVALFQDQNIGSVAMIESEDFLMLRGRFSTIHKGSGERIFSEIKRKRPANPT